VFDGERPPPAGAWASPSCPPGDGSHGTCSPASGSLAGGTVDREARRAPEGVRLCPPAPTGRHRPRLEQDEGGRLSAHSDDARGRLRRDGGWQLGLGAAARLVLRLAGAGSDAFRGPRP